MSKSRKPGGEGPAKSASALAKAEIEKVAKKAAKHAQGSATKPDKPAPGAGVATPAPKPLVKPTERPAEATDGQAQPAEVDIGGLTMLGDLCALVVDEIKAAPDVWAKLSEEKQEAMIGRIRQRVGEAVGQAVRAIAANGRVAIAAKLEQVTVKDGLKAVLTMDKHDPQRHELLDATGRAVMIVIADPSEFAGGTPPKAEPDQRALPLEGNADGSSPAEQGAQS